MLKNGLTKNIECKLNKRVFDMYKTDRLSQIEYLFLQSTDAVAPRL